MASVRAVSAGLDGTHSAQLVQLFSEVNCTLMYALEILRTHSAQLVQLFSEVNCTLMYALEVLRTHSVQLV